MHHDLHLTLIFPAHYFDDASRRALLSQFAVLQSSKQIEIALALENEPMLPLLGNLQIAGEKVAKWGFNFAWPEDIAAQIARGSGKYQKRFSALPTGFYPPHQSLSEDVVETLKRFRMNWVMGRPSENWGIRFYGGIALLVPPKAPVIDEMTVGGRSWAEHTAAWAMEHPFVLINTESLEDPKTDQYFLEYLAKGLAKHTELATSTAQLFVEPLRDEFELAKSADPFANDYGPWVSLPQQKRAWAALADARKVIDTYQRSGHAKLQRLDAAIEEMCTAESGEFLLNIGSDDPNTNNTGEKPSGERNFLATLANIYRLCETPVPTNLNTWFAARSWQKTTARPQQSDEPFFEEGAQNIAWNDPKGDDNGNGKYVYPVGAYPKGMFDLRQVSVSWDESDITLRVNVAENFSNNPTNIVPLLDFYIDVNRLTDAGSTNALRRRGNTLLMREAAWEYSVALSANCAALYQAIPGSNPRLLSLKSVTSHGNTFSISFPRTLLRGDPKRWRVSAGLLGTENTKRQEEPLPVSVLVNPTERNFGGGASGQVTPFIDLLDPTIEDQTNRIDAGQAGPLNLPYVESQ